MTGILGLFSDLENPTSLPCVTLADALTNFISSLGSANHTPLPFSLSSVFYVPLLVSCLLVKLRKLLTVMQYS